MKNDLLSKETETTLNREFYEVLETGIPDLLNAAKGLHDMGVPLEQIYAGTKKMCGNGSIIPGLIFGAMKHYSELKKKKTEQ
jgi:hypothetical protein